MAKIYGHTLTTPIKPNLSGGIVDQTYNPNSPNAQSGKAVAEAIKDKATIYKGTQVAINFDDGNGFVTLVEMIADGGTLGGVTVTPPENITVSEFALNLKVGDFYYNTEEEKTYVCIKTYVNDTQTSASSVWKDLSIFPDTTFNPESLNAPSGKAIHQELSYFALSTELNDYCTKLSAELLIEDAIGDIETALDNIITKYGLGGETV